MDGIITQGMGTGGFPVPWNLHFFNCDALDRTDFNAAHTAHALACIEGIGFSVTHPIDSNRADIDALSAAGAFYQIHIDKKHSYLH